MSFYRYALSFVALLLPILALSAPYAYTLSGDEFVKMMNRPEPLNSYDYMQREKAYSYLDGARDAAEGTIWCDRHTLKTPDMAYELADDIAKLPAKERAKNASILLQNLLLQKYPCARGARP